MAERDSSRLLELSTNIFRDSSIHVQPQSTENSPPLVTRHVKNCAWKYSIGGSMTSMLLGFDIGVMSEAMTSIKKDTRVTNLQVDVLAVALNVLMIVGSAMAGRISDKIGRRKALMWTGVFFFLGTLLTGFASNNAFVLSGRAIIQVGAGFALVVAPVYVAELSPPFSRGLLTSIPKGSIDCGILLGYSSNFITSKFDLNPGRVVILSLGAVSSVLLAIVVHGMPESPRWLVMQGRLGDAGDVLAKTSDSEQEAARRLLDIMTAVGIPLEQGNANIVQVNRQSFGEGVWQDLLLHRDPCIWHMVICAIGVQSIQQATGVDILLLYAPRIFEKADVKSFNGKLVLTIAVHTVKTLSNLVPTFLLDRVGRRQMLLRSIGGMSVSLMLLGICLTAIDHSDTSETKPKLAVAMCIPSLFLYLVFNSMGMGPTPSVYNVEIFPLRLRAQGCALGLIVNQLIGAILSLVSLPLYKAIALGGVTFIFTGIAILACLFAYIFMPETNGRTLEEIWQSFGQLFIWRFGPREIEVYWNNEETARQAASKTTP